MPRSTASAAVTSCVRAEGISRVTPFLERGGPRRGGPLSFQLRIDLVGCRVHLAGHPDRGTVHLLHDAISMLLLTDGDVRVVGATHVTACDPVGIRGLGTAYRRALRHDRRLRLTGARPFCTGSSPACASTTTFPTATGPPPSRTPLSV